MPNHLSFCLFSGIAEIKVENPLSEDSILGLDVLFQRTLFLSQIDFSSIEKLNYLDTPLLSSNLYHLRNGLSKCTRLISINLSSYHSYLN